jgi:hypothetical protein
VSWKLAGILALITALEFVIGLAGMRALGSASMRTHALFLVCLSFGGLAAATVAVARFAPGAAWPTAMLAGLVFAGFHAVPPLCVAIVLSVALSGMNAEQLQHAAAGDSLLGGLLALVERFTTVAVGVAVLLVWLIVAAYAAACAIVYPLAISLFARLFRFE